MPLKPHPTDPDKMVFDNKDRIAAIEKLGKQAGVCAKCGGIVYDPVIPQLGRHGLREDDALQLLPVMPYEYEIDVEMILEFASAIEQALKEKNHAV